MSFLESICALFAWPFSRQAGVRDHTKYQAVGPRWEHHRRRRIDGYRRRRSKRRRSREEA